MRIDLHCHSEASADCSTPLRRLGVRAIERGLSVLAVTDHDEIWGAEELAAMTRSDPDLMQLQVIVGEEVTTSKGEIIGLFLQERIPPGLEPEDVVHEIRRQGGLVLLPHGFDPFKAGRLQPDAREEIAESIEVVEGFNRRISLPHFNRRARAWAEAAGKLVSSGSDAHTLASVGEAWAEVPDGSIASPSDLRSALRGAELRGAWRQPVLAYLEKMWTKLRGGR